MTKKGVPHSFDAVPRKGPTFRVLANLTKERNSCVDLRTAIMEANSLFEQSSLVLISAR